MNAVYFYSRMSGLMITVPADQKNADGTTAKIAGRVLQFTPLGNVSSAKWGLGSWGVFAAVDQETIKFLEDRRVSQGETPDVVSAAEFNTEMQIEARGERSVLADALNQAKATNSLLQKLVDDGILNPDFTPTAKNIPDEAKRAIIAEAEKDAIPGVNQGSEKAAKKKTEPAADQQQKIGIV